MHIRLQVTTIDVLSGENKSLTARFIFCAARCVTKPDIYELLIIDTDYTVIINRQVGLTMGKMRPLELVFVAMATIVHVATADHPVQTNPATDVQPQGCTTLMFEGKGDFRVQRKIYTAQTAEHYIFSLRLLKRTSFYKCEPSDTRYGISDDGHSWWVDRGCEAIFEVVECPNNGAQPPPDPLTKLYDQLKKRLSESTQTLDLSSWNPNSFMNRFESISPMSEP
ncbi:hypothetical protein MAR_014959 [Mya arenaria]|uniref:Uncharacterized protein n=1 Tax=Mya arenaria TaxID=6604 RepID=A0ABY7FFY9_MYAAR|nr:hypothetical protein MAR_014959 [Mya arenaria]